MGWIGSILFSIIWNILILFKIIPVLGTSPVIDIVVKGIIGGFLIITIKEFSPI